jgi:hypothetical protein
MPPGFSPSPWFCSTIKSIAEVGGGNKTPDELGSRPGQLPFISLDTLLRFDETRLERECFATKSERLCGSKTLLFDCGQWQARLGLTRHPHQSKLKDRTGFVEVVAVD